VSRIAYNGFEDLSNKLYGTVRIGSILRRQPSVAWNASCERCGSSFILNHDRARDGVCPRGVACGRVVGSSPSIGRSVVIPTGVRASDSASAYSYAQHQPGLVVTMRPITDATLSAADPGTVARFIEHQRGKRN
jgi:hypothetical protein